jgi:hypothetical protein
VDTPMQIDADAEVSLFVRDRVLCHERRSCDGAQLYGR